MPRALADARCVVSPGLVDAPVLDRLCTHFVLTLTLRHSARLKR